MSATQPVKVWMRQQPDGSQEWTMRCPHGEVTTEEVFRRYSRAEILTAWAHMSAVLPAEVSRTIVAIAAIRELLGRLALEKWECSCDLEPFALVERRPEGRRVH
jgi:hypothetical protein